MPYDLWGLPGYNQGTRGYGYAGVNLDRQTRFDARSARRWGNWGVLTVPRPILWLEDEWAVSPYGDCEIVYPELVELWP